MDIEYIENLMRAMNKEGVNKVVIKEKNGSEIELKKELGTAIPHAQFAKAAPVIQQPARLDPTQEVTVANEQPAKGGSSAAGEAIPAPMVGTFYVSPGPEADPFVKAGDTIKEGQIICIIEAMKVMNEIKAEHSGTITEVLVKNGEPVEYGQELFRIQK